MIHELKILPQYFERVKDGTKTFEIRENDRGFQPGDMVILKEWDDTVIEKSEEWGPSGQTDHWREARGYTGKEIRFDVGYVLPVDSTRVVFSLLECK